MENTILRMLWQQLQWHTTMEYPVESIRKSICEFTAVAHRIEYVTEKKGVAYYNDSKGTNPDAAIKGIQAMNRPTLLIGGGYDRQSGMMNGLRHLMEKYVIWF